MKDLVLQDPLTSDTSPRSSLVHLTAWLEISILITLMLDMRICLSGSQNSGKHRSPFTSLWYNKGSDKGYQRTVRYIGRGTEVSWAPELLSLWRPPSMWVCSSPWKLSRPHTLGIFMKVSCRHDRLLVPFLASLPSPENDGWTWKFSASSHDLVSLVTSQGAHPKLLH